jgi:hypothetical protein
MEKDLEGGNNVVQNYLFFSNLPRGTGRNHENLTYDEGPEIQTKNFSHAIFSNESN